MSKNFATDAILRNAAGVGSKKFSMTFSYRRLDPTLDVIFKKLFATAEEPLIALLAAILAPKIPIQRAEIRDPEMPEEDDERIVLGVVVWLEDGTAIDVEMQMSSPGALAERSVFYVVKQLTSRLGRDADDDDLRPSVGILLLRDQLYPSPEFHRHFLLRNLDSTKVFSDLLGIHTIELSKVTAATENSALSRWCRFFSTRSGAELESLCDLDPMIRKAEKRLAELSEDETTRQGAEHAEFLRSARDAARRGI